jgi:putative glutamine amidotransferase
MKIAIFGKKEYTKNYEKYVESSYAAPIVTLDPGLCRECDALILPGGGDISPIFYGEECTGSENIDTELDILQFQALEQATKAGIPVLGICKGMQLINVSFGGTLTQHMTTAGIHTFNGCDSIHDTCIAKDSLLYKWYGNSAIVNSAHHQCVKRLGKGLIPIQWCTGDSCIEAIVHEFLPVLGLQWHPERLDKSVYGTDSSKVMEFFKAAY